MNLLPCEVCGEPSTVIIVDKANITTFADHYRCARPHSTHYFCAAHQRESVTYHADMPAPVDEQQQPAIRFTSRNRGVVRLAPLGGDCYMLQEVEMYLPSHPKQRKTPDCWQPHGCEVCGAPAAGMVCDTIDVTPPGGRHQQVMQLPPVHYYCEQHLRDSVQVAASAISANTVG